MSVPARPDFARTLNPEQLAAVTHGDGPQLVLAGAGSGKTRVITYRIAWLILERRVEPDEIAAVTFTNKAAGEMRERTERLLGRAPLPVFLGTFHRFALQLLRRYGERVGLARDFAILDTDDQLGLIKQALAAEGLAETSYPPRTMLAAISGAKNRLLGPDAYEREARDFFAQRVSRVFRRYQGLLQQASGVDFDDMLALAVRLLAEHPDLKERVRRRARHLMVDEFQDTNHAQLRLIGELMPPDGNLTAVGDEDQGIYRWRGADLDNILSFERHFPSAVVRKLERNYRSSQTILSAANAVVSNNRHRRGKRLWTDAGAGEPITVYRAADEVDEARWVARTLSELAAQYRLSDLAVLVRTNAQTRAYEDEFFQQRIPYTLVGGVRFYERAEIKDLIAYLRLLRNSRDSFSLARVINQPPRGIGKTTQQALEERAIERGVIAWDLIETADLGAFPARASAALRAFRDLLAELRGLAAELPLPALLDELLRRTGYAELYRRPDPEDEARLENIREFLSAAQSFTESRSWGPEAEEDMLTAFLDHVALFSDVDLWNPERGVSLMTLHSAKGLEFPAVVVGGLEEGLLPHYNTQGRPEDVEEERRLLYVGMTRARERLHLTVCRRRRIAGRYQDQTASPFLDEVPARLTRVVESPSLFSSQRVRGVYDFFGREPGAPIEEEPSSATRPRRGARVRHPSLGQGVVLDLEGDGDDLKITVYFDRAGKRKLIARYASLEPI